MGKRDQVVPESSQTSGPSEPPKPSVATEPSGAREAQDTPKAFVPTGRRFRVGRSFRAGGEMQQRGSVIEEQPWKNFNALVKVGYLIPIYADADQKIMQTKGEGVADGT
jgi:hypothetical protein